MNIRDRVKELRRVRAGDLRPHAKNWRTRPENQHNALRGMLAEVGYVDALIVRELSAAAGLVVQEVSPCPSIFGVVVAHGPPARRLVYPDPTSGQ